MGINDSFSESDDSKEQLHVASRIQHQTSQNVQYDFSNKQLKQNHAEYPLYVGELIKKYYNESKETKKNQESEWVVEIIIETFSPKFKECYEFVVQITDPKSRQEFIQTYEINSASLFASVTLGMNYKKIIQNLEFFNKFQTISNKVKDYIKKTTSSYGKCKLVLQNNDYFLESDESIVLKYYKSLNSLDNCWIGDIYTYEESNLADLSTTAYHQNLNEKLMEIQNNEELIAQFEELNFVSSNNKNKKKVSYRLKIQSDKLDVVRIARDSHTQRYKYMLNQEYAYESDKEQRLEVSLKPNVKIRMYQEKALSNIFVKGRARSGIIVLPCGAGKTLVGILTMCQIKRKTLILCINNLNVKQWCKQIELFTKIDQSKIIKFVSESKNSNRAVPSLDEACVVVSTYSMISRKDELRSEKAYEFMQNISKNEWGLLILDEVQVAPAEVFKKAFLTKTKSHCKIGLTATLLREDNKIEDLQFYIGPKLYEESWIELTKQGFLARVQCVEIRVEMPKAFLFEYQRRQSYGKNMGMYLYTANPNKFVVIQYLINLHRARGDKILIFIDTIDILMEYAKILNYPYICGDVKDYERDKIISFFKHLNDDWNVLLISRVGDVGIDLPDANVAIEVSSLFGSRRQEAQRLGRILRPKDKKKDDDIQSYFYSLISLGTEEVRYGFQRQKFLIQQGYSFKSIHEKHLPYNESIKEKSKFKISTEEEQKKFLEKIMTRCIHRQKERINNLKDKEEDNEINVKKKDIFEDIEHIYVEKKMNNNGQ